MLEAKLPLTSYFCNKNDKECEKLLFHFKLRVNKQLNCICLEKIKENPSIKYRHKWLTCFEPENHLDLFTDYLLKNYLKKDNLNIFGFSFKDDTFLKRINEKTKNKHNIKSSSQLGLPVTGACLNKLFEYCEPKNIKNIFKKEGKADILIVRHILEHSQDIDLFIKSLKLFLNKEAYIIFEVPDSERGLKSGMQTLLWEEHSLYFTEDSLFNTLQYFGFQIIEFFRYPNDIEDVLVVIAKINSLQKKENKCSINKNENLLKRYENKFNLNKKKIRKRIKEIINSGSEICLFGAGHHASSFVSINEINNQISFVIDDNIEKQNCYLAGTSIPIMSLSILKRKRNKLNIFLTTNPEKNIPIIKLIKSINSEIVINTIFDFY